MPTFSTLDDVKDFKSYKSTGCSAIAGSYLASGS